jgi:ribonuclease D
MEDIIYIEDSQALEAACQKLNGFEWLAVDTEFIREKTYFPQIALIQVAHDDLIYCIDPLAIADLSPLFKVLENPAITKVFHAASQDLEIFYMLRAKVPTPIFDTQVAATLLGMGDQIGYAALVNELLGIELDKSHSRTNWMQRPLRSKQIRYAADDVRYLSQLYPVLVNKLEKLGRLEWMTDEQTRLLDPATYQPDPQTSWQRIKGAGKLEAKPLNVLKHLAAWREQEAIQKNRPRRWILSDGVLLGLANQQPTTHEQLLLDQQLTDKIVERYASKLINVIAKACNEPKENWPAAKRRKKPSPEEQATIDLLMAVVRLCADEHQLTPKQITSRSELLKLIRGEQNLPLLKGWRLKIAGQAVVSAYQGKLQPERGDARDNFS